MPRNPEPGWDGRRLSQCYVADYKPFQMVDGEGVRCSLYVSGCLFHCEGCFNEATWSFRYGTAYTDELEERILADLAQPYVQGLTLLGGEPFLNTPVCVRLARLVRERFAGEKEIWCWTGYTWEELQGACAAGAPDKAELLGLIDVLVDGRFLLAEKDLTLAFRGSRNQRIIDVPASMRAGSLVLWQRADPAHRARSAARAE